MSALIVTSEKGQFSIRLRFDRAPKTCSYFCDLVDRGAFNDASIFRILSASNQPPNESCPIHVIQIGPRTQFLGNRHPIEHENTQITTLAHRKWTVSAARFDLGELYGSFFVCMRDEPQLDFGGRRQPDGQGFAAFGEIISGFDAVERLFGCAELNEMLDADISIHDVRIEHGDDQTTVDTGQ